VRRPSRRCPRGQGDAGQRTRSLSATMRIISRPQHHARRRAAWLVRINGTLGTCLWYVRWSMVRGSQSAAPARCVETRMQHTSSCSCRLGWIVRVVGLGRGAVPNKRRWQYVGSAFLFFVAFVFYTAISTNVDHHGTLFLAVCSFFGIATFLAALLNVIVSIVGCDDCVSRL
jgi:hypothetical protein